MNEPPSLFWTIPPLPRELSRRSTRCSISPAALDAAFPCRFAICCARLPASDQVYAALTGGVENLNLPLPREGNLGNILQALRSVDSATLGMDLSKGMDAIAMVNCNTERDAKFVHDLVRGLVGFGRLNTPDNQPDLLKLYDAIQVTQQQAQTKVTANVPQELADKFLDLWLKK